MAGIIPYETGDIVEMKKQHPCKKSNQWKIVRMGQQRMGDSQSGCRY